MSLLTTKIFDVRLGPFVAELICRIRLVQGHNPVCIHLAPEETKHKHQAESTVKN